MLSWFFGRNNKETNFITTSRSYRRHLNVNPFYFDYFWFFLAGDKQFSYYTAWCHISVKRWWSSFFPLQKSTSNFILGDKKKAVRSITYHHCFTSRWITAGFNGEPPSCSRPYTRPKISQWVGARRGGPWRRRSFVPSGRPPDPGRTCIWQYFPPRRRDAARARDLTYDARTRRGFGSRVWRCRRRTNRARSQGRRRGESVPNDALKSPASRSLASNWTFSMISFQNGSEIKAKITMGKCERLSCIENCEVSDSQTFLI